MLSWDERSEMFGNETIFWKSAQEKDNFSVGIR